MGRYEGFHPLFGEIFLGKIPRWFFLTIDGFSLSISTLLVSLRWLWWLADPLFVAEDFSGDTLLETGLTSLVIVNAVVASS